VEYDAAGRRAGLPTAPFATTTTLRQRALLGSIDVLRGEAEFFLRFRPRVDMEAPVAYWGGVDDRDRRSCILMEDIVATRGARFVEPTDPLSRSQVEDLVRNVARYHGAFWEHPELPHGDAHAGQTYVTADGRMGLTDWQATQQGGWAYDVAYLVGSTCEPEDRRAWERDLLALYLDELARSGGDAPSEPDAFLADRRQMLYPFSAWAFTIGRAAHRPRMQPDATSRVILRRLGTAIDDLDSCGAVGV